MRRRSKVSSFRAGERRYILDVIIVLGKMVTGDAGCQVGLSYLETDVAWDSLHRSPG
jgi:hypothetical protein